MARAITYKFTSKIKSREDEFEELTSVQFADRLRVCSTKGTYPSMYEVILGACVPYYDFDISYDDKETWEASYKNDTNGVIEAVESKWGHKAKYFWRVSHGYNPEKKKYVNSYHCIVRGVGYYRCGKDIPRVETTFEGKKYKCDDSVYKFEGKRQLFRTIYSSKEGQMRPAKRLLVTSEEVAEIELKEYITDPAALLGDTIEDNFVTNIQGEILREAKVETKVETKEEKKETKREAKEDTIATTHHREVSIDEIKDHIKNMKPSRANRDSDVRHKVVWAIANIAVERKTNLKGLAHLFRRLDAEDYENDGYDSCERCYDCNDETRDHKADIQTILAISKEDNEAKYNEIILKHAPKIEEVKDNEFEYFLDYRKLMNKSTSFDIVRLWFNKTIAVVSADGRTIYIVKRAFGDLADTKVNHVTYDIYDKKGLKEALSKSIICPNPYYTGAKNKKKEPQFLDEIYDVVERLVKREDGIHVYTAYDFYPWCKVAPPESSRVFNTFLGFSNKTYVPSTEVKYVGSPWHEHIRKDICGGDVEDPGLFEAFEKEIAYTIQNPGIPTQKFIVIVGQEGGGKSSMGKFWRGLLDAQHVIVYPKSDQFFAEFNSEQKNKIVTCIEELGEYHELNKHEEALKGIVTAESLLFNEKFIKKCFMRNVMHLWAFTNKPAFQHMPGQQRRTFTMKMKDLNVGNVDFWDQVHTDLSNKDYMKAAFDYYNNMDLRGYNPRKVFETKFKASRKEDDKPLPLKHLEYMAQHTDEKEETIVLQSGEELHSGYLRWCRDIENTSDKLKRTTYIRMMKDDYGFRYDRIQVEGDRVMRFQITRTNIRDAIRRYLRSPDWDFE